MPYTLRFSDAAKVQTVNVPDMPPGVNTIDTSLTLVGRNYPNYGEKIAQNFLSLLENFASPLPPENPIEGQLWYDTSDPNSKVLRIMDGTADSTRWPAANGIYQQGTDPRSSASAGLKVGDIWVDTQNNLLKIYHSGNWTTVGPSVSSGLNKTGVEPAILKSTTNTDHSVILNYVNGKVISVVSDSSFVPLTLIDGFESFTSGINLTSNYNSIVNGVSDMSAALKIGNIRYSSNRVLIKDDQNVQIITGRIFFQTPTNQLDSEGRDGVVIDTGSLNNKTYVQFYKLGDDAVLLNNKAGGKIVFKTKPSNSANLVSSVVIENKSVSINTVTNSLYALNVNGKMLVSQSIISNSTVTYAISLNSGGMYVDKNLDVNQMVYVQNSATIGTLLTVGNGIGSGTIITPGVHNIYDIGSSLKYFRSLYVSRIGSTGTGTVVYGKVIGNATGLEKSSEFKLQGQVTATSFIFAGTGTAATFNTQLTRSAILDQPVVTNATSSTLTLLVLDTSTTASYTGLQRVSRRDFVEDIFPTGIIMAYGGTTTPDGWLPCDGVELYASDDYPKLFPVIDSVYRSGVNFRTPDMTTSTLVLDQGGGSQYIKYIIKT